MSVGWGVGFVRMGVAAPPEYRPTSYTEDGTDINATFGTNIPAVVQVGDLLLIGHLTESAARTLIIPTGWTQLHTSNAAAAGRYATFYKFADSGDVGGGTNVTLGNTQGFADDQRSVLIAYSGINPSNPFNAVALATNSGLTGTSPAVTTTVSNTTVVRISGVRTTGFPSTLTTPPTKRVEVGAPAQVGHVEIALSDATQAAAGSSGTGTFTSNVTGAWYNVTLALEPV